MWAYQLNRSSPVIRRMLSAWSQLLAYRVHRVKEQSNGGRLAQFAFRKELYSSDLTVKYHIEPSGLVWGQLNRIVVDSGDVWGFGDACCQLWSPRTSSANNQIPAPHNGQTISLNVTARLVEHSSTAKSEDAAISHLELPRWLFVECTAHDLSTPRFFLKLV